MVWGLLWEAFGVHFEVTLDQIWDSFCITFGVVLRSFGVGVYFSPEGGVVNQGSGLMFCLTVFLRFIANVVLSNLRGLLKSIQTDVVIQNACVDARIRRTSTRNNSSIMKGLPR